MLLITYLKFTKKECKGCKKRRKIKSVCNFFGLKNNKLRCKCEGCKKKKKKWLKPINGLIKKFSDTHQFCNGDIKKIVLLLGKDVYPYEYMNSWERFDEPSLLDKTAFYKLYLEDIAAKVYAHAQKVLEELKRKICRCIWKL